MCETGGAEHDPIIPCAPGAPCVRRSAYAATRWDATITPSEFGHRRRAMSTVIDPVQSPQAYQTMLIDLVGDDDPAEVQEATSAALRAGRRRSR